MADWQKVAAPGTENEKLLRTLDPARLPAHIAIIMDGNGRWARKRLLPRVAGHRAGIESVRDTVEASAQLGIGVVTLYAFSKENWKRPRAEVETLFDLLCEYLRREIDTLMTNNIRFRVIGRKDDLFPGVRRELDEATQRTAGNTGMIFNTALSYSGRSEIADACRSLFLEVIASGATAGSLGPDSITEEALARHLYTAGLPDPDLLIRTSGELRVSNFLLWQIAYAEIFVTETLWPDFRRADLMRAIASFQKRERRFGGIDSASPPEGAPVTGKPSVALPR
jgi:undecaprenyl diphosphate synthase